MRVHLRPKYYTWKRKIINFWKYVSFMKLKEQKLPKRSLILPCDKSLKLGSPPNSVNQSPRWEIFLTHVYNINLQIHLLC